MIAFRRRSEYLVRITYPSGERTVPLSAARFARRRPGIIPPVRKGSDHNAFLRAMHSIFYAAPPEQYGSPKQDDDRGKAYSFAFSVVFGRMPPAAELNFMTGEVPDLGKCERCGEAKMAEFLPDGTCGSACARTRDLDRAFAGNTEMEARR